MVRKLALLLVLLALACATAPVAHATFRWQYYNVDPFAQTREEAMAWRQEMFIKAGLSKACIATAMQATSQPGKPGRLVNGNRLDWMASSGGRLNRNVVVALVNVDKGVEVSPLTEEWTVSCDGRKLTIILPQACNNWSGRMTSVPKPRRSRVVYTPQAPYAAPLAPAPRVDNSYPYPPFPQVVCIPRGSIKCPN